MQVHGLDLEAVLIKGGCGPAELASSPGPFFWARHCARRWVSWLQPVDPSLGFLIIQLR